MERIINLKVGNDSGNSEHDIIMNGTLVSQPNVFAKVKELPVFDDISLSSAVKYLHENLIVTINSPSCQPSIYYIGNKAIISDKRIHNMELGSYNDKVNSDIVIVNTLGQIAAFAVKNAYEKDKELDGQIVVNVDMTTSLPVTQYNRESAEKLKNKFMNGKHNVIVHIGNLRVDVDILFEFVKVLPESVPVVFALQKKEGPIFEEFQKLYDKKIDGSYFKNKRILHGAIGEGTTEYPVTSDIVFNPDFIKGSNNGIGHAIEAAMKPFLADVQLRTYSRQNYSMILRDPSHKYYSKAIEHMEEPLENEADAIIHNLKTELEKANNEVDIICIHGGGSILMKPHLYEKLLNLCNKTSIKLFYVPEAFAITLESEGLYEFVTSDIFKTLKKKAVDKDVVQISE